MSQIQRREVAYRLFANEFDDATLSHQESDEERAPNYVVTPTGARANRMFAVGVLTEVESVNDDVLRGRVVDPTGAFVVYAGQYQPDEMAVLESTTPPAFVAITGKARTFSPDDSDRVFTSIRPESINAVDADTRDRWVVTCAEKTLQRIATMAEAATMDATGDELRRALEAEGVPPGLAAGIPLALDHYGTTPAYLAGLREVALDAVRVVAGDRDEVREFSLAPDESGDGTATWESLRDRDRSAFGVVPVDARAEPAPSETADEDAQPTAEGSGAETADVSLSESGSDLGESDVDLGESDTDVSETDSGPSESASEPTPSESEPATTEPETVAATASASGASSTGTEAESELSDETSVGETGESAETEPEAADTVADDSADDGSLGDFEPGDLGVEEEPEPGTVEAADSDAGADPAAASADGMYQMDDEERAEIEAEFGTEFSSGNDVPDAGESDIETPEPPEEAEPEPATEDADGSSEDAATESADAGEADEDSDADAGDEVDVDLDDYVIEVMSDLDDGDGANRAAVVERVVADTGATEDEVDDAIQNALIGGHCYEPDDDTLKPI
ncbi:hypothetical protein [Haloarchaeobius sp. TZWWS8]|uniref:RPA family protein n=1 Tax=Haloarchaeobius sp. TZWWS8 TaxID=3446121 RepID=UPI003EBC9979